MKQFLFAAFLLVQGQAGTTVETGAVTGRLSSRNGAPAASVRIAAMPVADDKTTGTVLVGISQTDESGSYRLADIPPGRYYIFAGLIDHPNYYPGTVTLSDATVVTVDSGATVANVDFFLVRPVSMKVSGRLSGSASPRDVPSMSLTLSPRSSVRTGISMSTTVAANGTFTFSPVLPGEYVIASTARGVASVNVTVTDDDVQDVELPTVDCNAGVEVRGRLAGVPVAPVERVSLTGARFRCTADVGVLPDGSFVFSSVPDDAYSVRLTPTPVGWSASSLVVQSRNIADLEIPLPIARDVRGRVVVEDGSTIPRLARGVPLSIQARGPSSNQVFTQNVDDDGFFALRVIKGRYRIAMPAVPMGYSLKSITSSEFLDLTLQPLDVTESGTEIRITLGLQARSPAGVQVSGRIIPPAAGALSTPEGVLLVSSSGGRNTRFLSTTVEGDGSFEFQGVAPGRYDLQTFPDSPAALREIDVSRTNVTGLELALPTLFKVNGAVEWFDAGEGTMSTAPQNLSVQFARRAQSRDEENGLFVWAALARAGFFQVYLPEGDYRFSITGMPKDAHITSATFGSLELLETDLQVRSSLDPMTVRVKVRQ
jgi:hypothetical protein